MSHKGQDKGHVSYSLPDLVSGGQRRLGAFLCPDPRLFMKIIRNKSFRYL